MTEFLALPLKPAQHRALLRAAHPDWSADQIRRVRTAFLASAYCAGAYCDGQLVGTIRLISDGIGFGLVADLLVHPQFRRQSIATNLLRLVEVDNLGLILYADPQSDNLADLYRRAGWQSRTLWRSR